MALTVEKTKEWISQNIPMLTHLYENKYVGMLYDRFASLPAKQQRQVVTGMMSGVVAVVVLALLSMYLSLWSLTSRTKNAYTMINMLQEHQRNRRSQEQQLQALERNNQLGAQNALRDYLMKKGQAAAISPRLIRVEEKGEAEDLSEEGGKGGGESLSKQATVHLERVNLSQLHSFLSNVEFGEFNLSVPTLKITNDDKVRGYMNVDMVVVVYLFGNLEEG